MEARHLKSESLTATASAKFLNRKTHFPRFDHIAGGGRKRLGVLLTFVSKARRWRRSFTACSRAGNRVRNVGTENTGCAACLGGPVDTFGRINKAGIKCISATNRNFPGRMGDKESQVFLASPATVAASAIAGRIADPREFLS